MADKQPIDAEQVKRWRLILGEASQEAMDGICAGGCGLAAEQREMDEALAAPSYNEDLAKRRSELGMPCFGCVPDRLPDLLAAVLKGSDLEKFAAEVRLS